MEKVEILVNMETNIWACIYRSLNRKRDIAYIQENGTDEQDQNGEKSQTDENPDSNKEDTSSLAIDAFNTNIIDDWALKNNASELAARPETAVVTRSMAPVTPPEPVRPEPSTAPKQDRPQTAVVRTQPKNSKNNLYIDEEMLVVYYVTDLIMLNKNSDALKAITEYTKKRELSLLCEANLLKAHAVLHLISKDIKDSHKAVEYFQKAAKCFNDLGVKKGVAMCRFGLSKVYHQCAADFQQDLTEEAILQKSSNF